MKQRYNKKRTLYLLISMIGLALLAFTIFYVILIDVFQLFTPQENSKGNINIVSDAQDTTSSLSDLDANSNISPAHGDDSGEEAYPTEEAILYAKALSQWLTAWYIQHGSEQFPITQFIQQISMMRFSEGNITPSISEVPEILTNSVPFFIDALLVGGTSSFTEKTKLRAYVLTFANHARAILDCIRTIAPLQQKDFIEMMRITQKIEKNKEELLTLNGQIQLHSANGDSDLLPRLAERKFTLQKEQEEYKLVLERFNSLFTSFYSRAEIRNIQRPIVHTVVTNFLLYAPEDSWKNYASSLLLVLTKLKNSLENFEIE